MTSGRSFAADPIVAAPGPLPPIWQQQLVHTTVDENVGLPDAATLTFHDPKHELLAATGITIGSKLEVSLSVVNGAPEPLFTGEVTALEVDSDTASGTFTVVRALSKAHRLFRNRRVIAFRNMTADAIVRKVIQTAGLVPGRIQAERISYPQLSQAGVTDWEFLQDLARQHGTVLRVDRLGKVDFVKPKPAMKAPPPTTSAKQNPFLLEYGRNLKILRAVLTAAGQADSVQVRGWNVDTKTATVANQAATKSKTVLPGLTGAKVNGAFGKATALATDTPYGNQAETTAAARSLAESISAGLGEIEAVVDGDPRLRAGTPVALGNVGPAFSGRYTATAVHHVLDPDAGYRTTVLVSASPDRSLGGLTMPAASTPRLPGVATAIVTDVRETGGAQRGWVKLKFPWLDATYQTDWVRTVQFGGLGGGGVFSPDVNDEVLVAFEQGLLDRPYVLGGLYNGKDVPSPHKLPLVDRMGKVNRRSLVSRKGHRLELIDGTTGPPGVRIASGNDRLEVRLDETGNKIDITVFAPGGRRALSSLSLTPQGITIDAGNGTLNLSGASVSIDARTRIGIDGGALATLRGRMVRIN
ncbi:VgrG-related protein [Amycolatopsis nigrescens]|uniref:VgrG-related protein n=1 Tax=Amycolatopsis nigrescens TaxID=381445 RepID=UPI00035C5118|nr:VgrG-related protein [Amycolatopsis nigrescens]